ncbi:MAG TPA: hypothetical protein VFH27_05785, partial [Longimicrobiaceae bacterium]|nr:hypothetical protein [Longimicrobiaceae bacterium]
VPPWLLARLGIATGVALGIRVGAVLLVLYWAASLLLWGAAEWRRRGRPALRDTGMLALRLVPPGLLAYGIMLAAWPWGQVDPLRNPLDAVRASAKFPFRVPVLFQGNTYLATELPWYYMPKLLLLTIPEFVLLGLAIALVRAVLAGRSVADLSRGASDVGVEGRRRVGTADSSDAEAAHGAAGWHGYVLVATAMLFPLAYACATHATLYDGQRHFLFAMPLAGVLAATAYAWLAVQHRRAGLVLGALATISAAYTAADMVRLHPYQSVYFNPLLAGGARGAEGRYDLDYWGASYREGAEWLARRFPAGSTARPLKVASCGAAASVTQFLPRRFEYVGTLMIPPLAAKPDVLLATPRFGCDRWLGGRVVHTIRREGAALVYVIEPAPSPPAPATAPPTAR